MSTDTVAEEAGSTPALAGPARERPSFALRPGGSVIALEEKDAWFAPAGPIEFELDPGAHGFPKGWVLFSAQLTRTILDGGAQLSIEHEGGALAIDIPISFSGKIFEVLKLPAGIRRMVWRPSRSGGAFRHTPVTMRRLGLAERQWLMGRRVAKTFLVQPATRRKAAGLGWWRPLVDLPGQYRACGKLRSYAHAPAYGDWHTRHVALADTDRRLIRARIARLAVRPHFALVVCGGGAQRQAATLASVDAQLYPHYQVVTPQGEDLPPLPPACDYVVFIDAGDRLAEHALYWMAETIAGARDAALVYADEDCAAADGTLGEPKFKPGWSPEHLRSINYVGRAAAIRRRELEAAGMAGWRSARDAGHALLLRVARHLAPAQVKHVPAPLYHRFAGNPQPEPRPRRRHRLPERAPLVSIVVPTRDGLALLRKCLDSIVGRSTYKHYEVLVVDNGTSCPDTLRYLASLEHRVIRYDAPFNFSAMNNLAARHARGEVLLLLNNDTQVISPDWLEEMLGHLCQKKVGAVGAKLYYADGRVQHAGDLVGAGGCADHLHVGLARGEPGYCHRAVVAHEVSAVTGACLMTWRHLYEQLGGLDERELPVQFNDVDYCLRLQLAGYRVVFTPHAELVHEESASRGSDQSAKQQARAGREVRAMQRRWGRRLRVDPYYNPNLNYHRADFGLAEVPRTVRPWRR